MTITENKEFENVQNADNVVAGESQVVGGDNFYVYYEPKEVLGKGASSTVRKCVKKSSGLEFAVKIIDLNSGLDSPDAILQESRREVSVLRALQGHPNIIELHDVFESSAYIFLVTELCPNGELFDYLTQVVTLSEKRARIIMRQLIDAVCFIHQHGIVHRDLKPENILLDVDLNVKVSDFGFAVWLVDETSLTELCGTPGYLAPEVLAVSMYENRPGYGRAVDLWACGVILYTLLAGQPPFWHRKQMFMLRAIMEGRYSFASPEWEDISEPPKDLIRRLLVVDPTNRLTAAESLGHPFFERIITMRPSGEGAELARRKPLSVFRGAAIAVLCLVRMHRWQVTPPAVTVEQLSTDPYALRSLRHIIDATAFQVYNHWVKKGEDQNRAALFEMYVRRREESQDEPSSIAALTKSPVWITS